MYRYSLLLLLLTLASCSPAFHPVDLNMRKVECLEDYPWKLVFEDNFEGNRLDRKKWVTYYPYGKVDECHFCRTHDIDATPHSGRGENQVFLDHNVEVDEGFAILKGKKDSVVWMGDTYPYSAGVIHTRRDINWDFTFGKYEIRAKLPEEEGWWPAFWLFGQCSDEIDVFEVFSNKKNELQTNINSHRGMKNGNVTCNEKYHSFHPYTLKVENLRGEFHTFSIEWTPYILSFYIDDRLINTIYRYRDKEGNPLKCGDKVLPGSYNENLTFPRQGPFSVIANIALQDSPDVSPEDDEMVIDYIRIWQRNVSDL